VALRLAHADGARRTPKPEEVLNKLKEKNILAVKFGEQEIRMVTHLDFSSHMLENTISTLKQLTFA
jgi:threonine aldolase